MTIATPRIYCLPATEAPIVAVFRRGPSDWAHVGRWDLDAQRYEPGAWLNGRIFPRRSDLSPDGRYLCYFAHKPNARWEHGEAYVAISRLPWLAALHAFGTCGTWTSGYRFTIDGSCEHAEDVALPMRYGLRSRSRTQFEAEMYRGWQEAPDSPPRPADDVWDSSRNARINKAQPLGDRILSVESIGVPGEEFGIDQAVDGLRVIYSLESDGEIELLEDVQWADWDRLGRLLVATRTGMLQIRDLDADGDVTFEADLTGVEPDPTPAPAWAHDWNRRE